MTTSQSTDSATAAVVKEYFDLHVDGVGYLNRTRECQTPGGTFLACDISALRGAKDNVQYTRFDCIVRGKNADTVVRSLMQDVDANKAVLIGFGIGDLYAETFTYASTHKDRPGETGVSLKARLLTISWAKVDGQMVYNARSESDQSKDDAATEQEAPASNVG